MATNALTRIRNNQVYNNDINAQYKLQPYSVTGGLLSNNFTYTGNMTIGNLTVNGQTTTIDTTNLVVADPLLAINRNQSGTPSYDLGFVMGRGNQTNVAMIWEEGAQQFQLQYTTESTAATTFGTINNSGYANLQAYGIKVNNATIGTSNVTNFVASNVAITGGTIDNTTIGATTPNSGVFTSVTTSSGGQLTGYHTGAIGANTANSGAFTTITTTSTLVSQGTITGAGQIIGYFNGAVGANAPNTVVATSVTTTNGGQLTGYHTGAIGANAANTGAFTTVTTTGTLVSQSTISAPTINAGTIGNTGATFTGASGTLTGNLSLNAVSAGQIGNVGTVLEGVIGSATPSQPNITSVGTLTSLTVSGAVNANTFNGVAVYAGTIGNTGAALTASTATITGTANSYSAGQGALQISGGFYAAGDSYIAGNLIVANLQATQQQILVVQEPLLYLQSYGIGTYNYDIGFYGHFIGGNNNSYQHTGLVRNYIDNDWYLFSNVGEPSGNVVTFNSNTVYDTLKLGALLVQNTTPSTSSTTGALQVAGGAGIVGNLNVGGNVNITGNINAVLSNVITQSGVFYGAPTTGFNALYAGQTGYTPLAQTLVQVSGNYNGFVQVNEQNTNSGASASTDFIATANNGNDNDTYIDLGINSSGYVNATYALQAANDGYLYVAGNTTTGGGNLVISTTTANDIIYSLGGIATANEFARMRANTNSFVISSTTNSTSTTTGALQVRGGVGVSGNVNVGSNLYVTGATFSGTILNYVPQYSYFQHGGNINNYVQIVNQNLNGGNQATTDYVAVANNGSDSDTFIDFGINSSGYNQTAYNLTGPNDGYLYVAGNTTTGGGNLVISTYTLNDIVFSLAGSATGNEIARYRANTNSYVISSTTNSTSTTTGALQVRGGAGVSGNIYSGANIYATTAISAPTMLNSNIYPLSGSDLYKNTGANGNLWINYNGVVANVIVNGNTAANYGNLFIVNGATGQVGIKQPIGSFIGNASFQVNSTDSIIIPVGTTSQRPGNATIGMMRYNTQVGQIEFWNGSQWNTTAGSFTVISENTYTGDGTTTAYTLSQSATTNATLVMINGVVQIPITAYSVSGTTLTFTEAPLSTDIIDARVITTTSQVSAITAGTSAINITDTGAGTGNASTIVNSTVRYIANTGTTGSNYFNGGQAPTMGNIALTQNTPTAIDSFSASAFRGAKYVIKVTDGTNNRYSMAELIVVHDGTTPTSQIYGVVNTGANALANFSTSLSGGIVYMNANTWSSTASATMFPTYMPV